MLYHENKAKQKGFKVIIGVDEAGRGPLAGPVVAAAVCLKSRKFHNKICDSKKISHHQREKAFLEILQNAYVGIGIMSEAVVDSMNILNATYCAMAMAIRQLVEKLPSSKKSQRDFEKRICILVDGNSFKTDLPYAYKTIIRGDNLSMSIACASIVAKVSRDRILSIYDRIFPGYGFSVHKGYPTKDHRMVIRKRGPSPIHRKTFKLIP
ncbi:MAG TPA: ribonuclease HII [Candidatus Omnitrophota bacterium]|nr:ribonuclease HII [Candidatus Omnitrophota bacterium]HPD85024.1 ribonuclease HII [Candidatus Omnitrophota bacterium]HRZ03882.1 ribonuclease HII [Candidatus Omnitrophota bacterium]